MLLAALLAFPDKANAELSTADPLGFFTNLSSRLLQSELGMNLNRIQIHPTNQYSPPVHRLLQVTANLLDATTNRFNTNYPYLPSVFRPLFTNDNDRVYICGYEEENGPGFATHAWRDLNDPAARAALQARDYVYGIPLVIGAKKGFPNFNEFALDTVFQITRQLQIRRPSLVAPKSSWETNQMFILGISNVFGVELWNSYRSNYARGVDIYAEVQTTGVLTNNFGLVLPQQFLSSATLAIGASNWSGTGSSTMPALASFVVPIRTNQIFLPDSIFRHSGQYFTTNLFVPFETGLGFPIPQWGITMNNRLRVFMVDPETQRLVDFVTLEGLNMTVDLREAIRDPDLALGFDGLWSTNFVSANLPVPQGVLNQINVGLGNYGTDSIQWRNYSLSPPGSSGAILAEVNLFRAFFGLGGPMVNTNLVQLCPFSPTRRISVGYFWQANDPLVHPSPTDLQPTNDIARYSLPTPVQTLRNLGTLNYRYLPWGGNPLIFEDDPRIYNAAISDPLVRRSDEWSFPDSEPLNPAMLGRVHRGTPWQTIYLKSAPADAPTWLDWLNDGDVESAQRTHPTRDWHIAALIASLLNTNPPQQLLSVNGREPDAWLACLDGLTVLTNTSTDSWLQSGKTPSFDSLSVSSNSVQAGALVAAFASARAGQPGGSFRNLGDFLATPELSSASHWLNRSSDWQLRRGISDEAYERLPSQLLPLLRADSVGSVVSTNDTWQLQFTGFDHYPYAIESSSDLVHWSSFSTNYPTNGVFSIPVAPTNNQFFRSRLLR